MHAFALSWQQSGALAVVAAGAGSVMGFSTRPRVRAAGAVAREGALIAALFGLWRLAGELSLMGTQDAMARSRWLQDVESNLFLPPERDVQGLVLGHPLAVQAANLYYATMHFAVVFAFLIWMFVRHREAYRPVRSVLAIATLICLLIQLVPFAPPRMFPGFVDTAALYGQSVYGGGFDGDQFSAMPSVHVAWAVLVAFYVWRIGSGGWRYLGIAHAGTTVLVVVATANHWWLDGIVGALVVVASAWIVVGVRSAWRVIRGAADTGPPLVPEAATRGPLVAAEPVIAGRVTAGTVTARAGKATGTVTAGAGTVPARDGQS